MKLTLSRFNQFLATSCWIVPLYFYVWIPVSLIKSSLPPILILISAAIHFLWVWTVKWKMYREKGCSSIRFCVDLSVTALGLIWLYSLALGGFAGIGVDEDILYILAYLTNIPAVITVKLFLAKQ